MSSKICHGFFFVCHAIHNIHEILERERLAEIGMFLEYHTNAIDGKNLAYQPKLPAEQQECLEIHDEMLMVYLLERCLLVDLQKGIRTHIEVEDLF